MVAIIMLLTKKTIQKINQDYPQFIFEQGSTFAWFPQQKTIYYNPIKRRSALLLLHELSHALLEHHHYKKDITLLDMEQEAWSHTIDIASHYNIKVDQSFIQRQLDSYRNWLYCRSLCPNCQNNGVQTKGQSYLCPVCNTTWHSNPAKNTELRRYINKK